jgi:hypothetical protein
MRLRGSPRPYPTPHSLDPGIAANGDPGLREVAASRHLVCGEHLDQKAGNSGGHAVEEK